MVGKRQSKSEDVSEEEAPASSTKDEPWTNRAQEERDARVAARKTQPTRFEEDAE